MFRQTLYGGIKSVLFLLIALTISLPLVAHASDKKILLLPLTIYADKPLDHIRKGVASMLASRLAGGGLEVIGAERAEMYLNEEENKGITSRKKAEELARKLNADCVMFGSISAIGSGYSLDLLLLELDKKGSSLTPITKEVNEDQFISELSELANELRDIIEGKKKAVKEMQQPTGLPKTSSAKAIFSDLKQDEQGISSTEKGIPLTPIKGPSILKPSGEIQLNIAVMSCDIGDLDGDGKVELAVIDRKKLFVYQREGKAFVLIDTRKASWGEEFFKISIGDIDNNGRAEIYLVSLYGMRARSAVYEWFPKHKRLTRRIGHLRVIKNPLEKKPLLLYQNSKVDKFFSGSVFLMGYDKKGELAKREQVPEMGGSQFYTLLSFDLDKNGHPEWIGLGEPNLNEQSKLHLWDKQGQLLWRGDENLGGTNNATRVGELEDRDDPPPRISFNSRLVITDIDGDGNKEILAIKNIPQLKHLLNFKVYTKSRLIAYRIEGTSLFPAWTTRDINWCLTDMQLQGQILFLAAQKGKWSHLGKGSSQIMWFE